MTPMPKTPAEHRAAWATATDLYAAALGIEVDPQTPDVSTGNVPVVRSGTHRSPANLRPTLANSRESDDRRLTCTRIDEPRPAQVGCRLGVTVGVGFTQQQQRGPSPVNNLYGNCT